MQINIPGHNSGIRWPHTYRNIMSGDGSPYGKVNDCVAEPEVDFFTGRSPEVYVYSIFSGGLLGGSVF